MRQWKLPLFACMPLLLAACSTTIQAPKPTPPATYISAGKIKVKAFDDLRRLDELKLPNTLYLKTRSPIYSANKPVSMPTYLLHVMQTLAKPSNLNKVQYPIYTITGTLLNMEAGKRKATDPLTLYPGFYANIAFTATLYKNGKNIKTVNIHAYNDESSAKKYTAAQSAAYSASLLDKTTTQAVTKMYKQLFS